MSDLIWTKSSYSAESANCVEVADDGNAVHIRDSKDPGGPTLTFPRGAWRAFLAGVWAGEFGE